MPSAKQEGRIPVASAVELAAHFESIEYALAQKETEDSWERIDKGLLKLEAVAKGGGYKFDEFVGHMKAVAGPLTRSLLSERTRLSGTAADVLNSIAPRLAERFEPLVNVYVPPLLQLCARTNKVAYKRAEKCLHLIAKHCRLPNTIPLLREACKDKVAGLRSVAIVNATVLVQCAGRERLARKVADIETIIHITATDSNSDVRRHSRELFETYVAVWPERVESFTTPFTPTIRRYLALPKTGPYVPPARTETEEEEQWEEVSPPSSPSVPSPSRRGQMAPRGAASHDQHLAASSSSAQRIVAVKSTKFLDQLQAAREKSRTRAHAQSTSTLRAMNTSKAVRAAPVRHTGQTTASRMGPGPVETSSKSASSTLQPVIPDRRMQPEDTTSPKDPVTSPQLLVKPLPMASEQASREPKSEGDMADCAELAPSDAVARRLASLAYQMPPPEQAPRLQHTPSASLTSGQASSSRLLSRSGKADGPRAARVVISAPVASTEAAMRAKQPQRQVSGSKAARVPEVSAQSYGTQSTPHHSRTPVVKEKESVRKPTNVSQQNTQSAVDGTKTPAAALKTSSKPMAGSPRKYGPSKATGKVMSSTTQSMSAKSKVLTMSTAQRRAAAASAQAAREAVVAKKQAEVAKLRAEAKVRSEQAALQAAEAQARVEARTRQLRAATQPEKHIDEAGHPATRSEASSKEPRPASVTFATAEGSTASTRDAQGHVVGASWRGQSCAAVAVSSLQSPHREPQPHGPAELSPQRTVHNRSPDRETIQAEAEDIIAEGMEEPIEPAAEEEQECDLAEALARLTPFKRCRRPNGSLDSPAAKIRAQWAFVSGVAASELASMRAPRHGLSERPAQQNKSLSSPLRNNCYAAKSPLVASAQPPLRKHRQYESSPVRTGQDYDFELEDAAKENAAPLRQEFAEVAHAESGAW
ncbi:unnamed protein product [Parajaminaea phylloscopi]